MAETHRMMKSVADDSEQMRVMWGLAKEAREWFQSSREQLWSAVKPDDLEEVGKQLQKRFKASGNKKTRQSGAYRGLDKQIKDFLSTCPLIAALKHKSMRPRHWELLMKATKKTFTPPQEDPGMKLQVRDREERGCCGRCVCGHGCCARGFACGVGRCRCSAGMQRPQLAAVLTATPLQLPPRFFFVRLTSLTAGSPPSFLPPPPLCSLLRPLCAGPAGPEPARILGGRGGDLRPGGQGGEDGGHAAAHGQHLGGEGQRGGRGTDGSSVEAEGSSGGQRGQMGSAWKQRGHRG